MKHQHHNPYLACTQTVITLLLQVKHQAQQPDYQKLHAQFINEIQQVEIYLRQQGVSERQALSTRYCLCAVTDEAILSTNWGVQCGWSQQTLLSLFHQETWGGERFYLILENALKNMRDNLDFIELLYVLLSLGFEGKFYNKEAVVREQIRNRLFYAIRHARGKVTRQLSTHAYDPEPFMLHHQNRRSLKKFAYVCLSLFLLINLSYNLRLNHVADPLTQQLAQLAQISPVTVFSQFTDIKRTRPNS